MILINYSLIMIISKIILIKYIKKVILKIIIDTQITFFIFILLCIFDKLVLVFVYFKNFKSIFKYKFRKFLVYKILCSGDKIYSDRVRWLLGLFVLWVNRGLFILISRRSYSVLNYYEFTKHNRNFLIKCLFLCTFRVL